MKLLNKVRNKICYRYKNQNKKPRTNARADMNHKVKK